MRNFRILGNNESRPFLEIGRSNQMEYLDVINRGKKNSGTNHRFNYFLWDQTINLTFFTQNNMYFQVPVGISTSIVKRTCMYSTRKINQIKIKTNEQ